jgi:hypothetical protein
MERQGPVVESADMFKFWASTMMVAVNKIDASSLQAYKLYKLDICINDDAIRTSFHRTFTRLMGGRTYIKASIHLESQRSDNIESIIPDYKVDVPVEMKKTKKNKKAGIDPTSFRLAARRTAFDMQKWDAMKKEADESTKSTVDVAEQSLDRTADKIRNHLSFSESGDFRVDKFQIREVKSKLDTIYNNILSTQSELPRDSLAFEEELRIADAGVRERIHIRITKSQALGFYIVMALMSGLLIIPTVLLYRQYGFGTIYGIIILLVIGLSFPAIVKALTLLWQRMKLRKALRKYKEIHTDLTTKIYNNVSLYSTYMSDISTHARGSSFLRTVQQQKLLKETMYSEKQQHLKDISLFLSYVNDWSIAFYCPVEIEQTEEIGSEYIDTQVPSNKNEFYTFDYGMSYQVPLNNTGDMLCSPVGFIDRILIEREELYDDNRNC